MKLLDDLYNRWAFARHKVQCAEFPRIYGRILVAKFATGGTIRIGRGVVINSSFEANPVGGHRTVLLIKGSEALIEIDDGVGMSNVILGARTRIYIGKNVMIGAGTKIFDNDFHSLVLEERLQDPDPNIRTKPVVIHEGAFIGGDAIIMKGVTIGARAVIGIGSVITRDVPAGQIWAGNPAKFIKQVPGA